MEFDDGKIVEAEGNPKTFMGLATKRAFKRQFSVPPVVLTLLQHAFVESDDGMQLNPDMPDEQLQHVDEEYLAYVVWLELCRRTDDMPDAPWDDLVDRIVDVEIDTGEDPTTAATNT